MSIILRIRSFIMLPLLLLTIITTPAAVSTDTAELVATNTFVFDQALVMGQGITNDGEYYYTSGSIAAVNITSLGKLDTVYVNLPKGFHFLFDRINQEQEEHEVTFVPVTEEEDDPSITENLELYGGFMMNRYNSANNF